MNNAINNYLSSFNATSKRTLEQMGNIPIGSIQVQRYPIPSIIDKIGNYVSNNALNELKQKYSYDKLYHLRMIINVNDHLYVTEKNEYVNITNEYLQKPDTEVRNVEMHGRRITLDEMVKNAISHMGAQQFHLYESTGTNCQHFVMNMLRYSNLLTTDLQSFIMQNVDELIPKLPQYAHWIMKVATTSSAVLNRVFGGNDEMDFAEIHFKKEIKLPKIKQYMKHLHLNGPLHKTKDGYVFTNKSQFSKSFEIDHDIGKMKIGIK